MSAISDLEKDLCTLLKSLEYDDDSCNTIIEQLNEMAELYETKTLVNVYQTCIEMLLQRNYDITEIDLESLEISALKPCGEPVMVTFSYTNNFDMESLKEIIQKMEENETDHVIVIYKNGVTSATNISLKSMHSKRIELFSRLNMTINITKHRLQPKFERLSDEEAKKFKKKYGTQFGIMKSSMPPARFYDFKRGDIIRITRNNGYITYRIVT